MKLYSMLLTVVLVFPLSAQKNVVPVSTSSATGIQLPVGTQQDKRILSTAAAAVVLETEAKAYGVKITSAEVLQLPAVKNSNWNRSHFEQSLKEKGWQIIPMEDNMAYGWLKRVNEYLFFYFEEFAARTDLYFGKPDGVPVFPVEKATATTETKPVQETNNTPALSENKKVSAETMPAIPPTASLPAVSGSSTQQQSTLKSGQYTFTKTNWDDGWISTIEDDKVVVAKGTIRVHVYYSLAHDDNSRNAGRDYYWDNYLTKEFRILSKQYRDHGEVISAFQAPYMEGTAIDPKTGKNCFLAFYVRSESGIMFPFLAIAPDEQTIRQTFPNAEKQYESDLAAMDRYNRFAVALPDLVGKWTGGGSAAMNYYNAYTGNYMGMSAVAMSDKFEFFDNGDYLSKHQGASGMVGAMSTYSQEYKGRAVITNWEIILPNRWEGKTSTFHAWFTAVRGGRVLQLQDKQYSGSRFSLVRE